VQLTSARSGHLRAASISARTDNNNMRNNKRACECSCECSQLGRNRALRRTRRLTRGLSVELPRPRSTDGLPTAGLSPPGFQKLPGVLRRRYIF